MSSALIGTGKAFWTLPEAVSSILFGDPSQPLPSRGEAVEEIAFAAEASHLGDKYHGPRWPPFTLKLEGRSTALPVQFATLTRQLPCERALARSVLVGTS